MNGQGPKLIIWIDEAGRVQVNGPIGNKGLCYILLECAKDAIRDYVETHQARIQVPDLQPPKDFSGHGR